MQQASYCLTAYNYALSSANRIHGDQAELYGFRGGLVPGVGIYAYMTHPVVEAWGLDWLERGAISVRLLSPVYDGESITVRAEIQADGSMKIEALNSEETACGSGVALKTGTRPIIDGRNYPHHPKLPESERVEPSISTLPAGTLLGDLDLTLDLPLAQRTFNRDIRAELPIYADPVALLHPAFLPAQANYILRNHIDLGPWIHAASDIQHYGIAKDVEPLSLRGRIAEAYEKKGHEFVVADLGLFGANDRPLAHIRHTAIVKPRLKS